MRRSAHRQAAARRRGQPRGGWRVRGRRRTRRRAARRHGGPSPPLFISKSPHFCAIPIAFSPLDFLGSSVVNTRHFGRHWLGIRDKNLTETCSRFDRAGRRAAPQGSRHARAREFTGARDARGRGRAGGGVHRAVPALPNGHREGQRVHAHGQLPLRGQLLLLLRPVVNPRALDRRAHPTLRHTHRGFPLYFSGNIVYLVFETRAR